MRRGSSHTKESRAKMSISFSKHLNNKCSVSGCSNKYLGKVGHEGPGYCTVHYTRVRRYGDASVIHRPRGGAKQGHVVSEETKQKISRALTGRKLSEEHCRKVSEVQKGKVQTSFTTKGLKFSQDTRNKMSESHKGVIRSEIHRRNLSIANIGKQHSTETREKMSASHMGSSVPLAQRQKISETVRRSYILGDRKPTTRYPRGNITVYNGIKFRSSWESKFAQWLDSNNIAWQYEPRVFNLGKTSYRPDFYIPGYGKWIEIKGFLRHEDANKICSFSNLGYDVEVLLKPELKELGVL